MPDTDARQIYGEKIGEFRPGSTLISDMAEEKVRATIADVLSSYGRTVITCSVAGDGESVINEYFGKPALGEEEAKKIADEVNERWETELIISVSSGPDALKGEVRKMGKFIPSHDARLYDAANTGNGCRLPALLAIEV
jgi:hypothetical protein